MAVPDNLFQPPPLVGGLFEGLVPMRSGRLLIGMAGLASFPAHASDYSGFFTLLGIPVLVVTLVAAGVIAIFPASRGQKVAIAVLFLPLLLAGVVILGDALSVISSDTAMAVVYLILLLGVMLAVIKLLTRPNVGGGVGMRTVSSDNSFLNSVRISGRVLNFHKSLSSTRRHHAAFGRLASRNVELAHGW